MGERELFLGIDVGTTKVAAVIVDPDSSGRCVASVSRVHDAGRPAPAGHAEQDAERLVAAAWSAVAELPAELRRRARAVGVAGQMHGVVVLDDALRPVTPLVTWEDRRCLEDDFLDVLNARTRRVLHTGFGCATLAWYAAHDALPENASSACTIHDLVAARLAGLGRPVTDASDAASWGLFDLDALAWDVAAVEAARIPRRLLPEVVACGARLGVLDASVARELGLPTGIPVAAALGDNQASVLVALDDADAELVLNLGTGGQLSAVLPAGARAVRVDASDTFECRPFPGGRFMLVSAALAGGSAWTWLVATVERWLGDLGLAPPSRDELFRRLNALGLDADAGTLAVRPHFLGERHDASLRGSIEGISAGPLGLGSLARALARGISRNLKTMLPAEVLAGRRSLVAGGNALRRNPLLVEAAREVFDLPVRLAPEREEAACGAALNAARLVSP